MDIAIIDNGIDVMDTTASKSIKEIINIKYDFNKSSLEVDGRLTENGAHGTLVMNTIEKYKGNSEISYYIINIMNEDNKGNSESIYYALKKLMK